MRVPTHISIPTSDLPIPTLIPPNYSEQIYQSFLPPSISSLHLNSFQIEKKFLNQFA